MKRGARVALIVIAGVAATACATGREPGVTPSGYLNAAEVAAAADALPLPGPTGAVAPVAPPGMDRWWLATLHAELSPPHAAQHFDCALGVRFMARPRPALTRAMSRIAVDIQAAVERASRRTFVARPIVSEPNLQACQRVTSAQREATAWPAVGGAAGAAYGELIAELAPDRAAAVRRVGEEIGRSRVVCRMNGPQDVADARRVGLDVYARSSRSPAFQADLAEARAEIAAARAEGLTNPGCAAERRAYGDPTWGLRPDAG